MKAKAFELKKRVSLLPISDSLICTCLDFPPPKKIRKGNPRSTKKIAVCAAFGFPEIPNSVGVFELGNACKYVCGITVLPSLLSLAGKPSDLA